jgi:hypothetical protein
VFGLRDVKSAAVAGKRQGTRTAAVLVTIFLLFLGASWAAVAQMTGHCESHADCLAVDHTPGNCLLVKPGSRFLVGTESHRCEASVWGLRFDVPFWAEERLRKLGVRFPYL